METSIQIWDEFKEFFVHQKDMLKGETNTVYFTIPNITMFEALLKIKLNQMYLLYLRKVK
jgi:hypothetical protein